MVNKTCNSKDKQMAVIAYLMNITYSNNVQRYNQQLNFT